MEKRKTIVVTGCLGFIGRKLVKQLSRNFAVVGLDIKSKPKWKLENFDYFKVDCGDKEAVRNFFSDKNFEITSIVNLAAYYDFKNSNSTHYQRLLDTLPIFCQALKDYGRSDSSFIQASSMASLLPCEPGSKITAEASSYDRWAYPGFKKKSEDIIRSSLESQRYFELVLAAVYSDWCELVPLFHYIESHRNKELYRWFHPADLSRGLTYTHIDDVVDVFEQSIKSTSGGGRFLVGENEATSYEAITEAVDQTFFQKKLFKMHVPKWSAKFGAHFMNLTGAKGFYQPWMIDFADEHYEFDISETEKDLNWSPKKSLRTELSNILANAKNNQTTWIERNVARPWHPEHWDFLHT